MSHLRQIASDTPNGNRRRRKCRERSRANCAYEVDGKRPAAAVRPGTAEEVAEIVKFAAAEKFASHPTGARTKLGIGMPPARYDLALDMTRLDQVIAYDPGDLTLSVEAGVPLAKLARYSRRARQFLPLAVPFSTAPQSAARSLRR